MRAVIIDDERLARVELRRLLSAHPGVEIVGEAGSGDTALSLIADTLPDLMFLDIQMPGMTGFDLLERLQDDDPPGHLHHRLRPARDPGVRGERPGLSAETDRPGSPGRCAEPRGPGDRAGACRRCSCARASAAGWCGSPTSACSSRKATTRGCTSVTNARSSGAPSTRSNRSSTTPCSSGPIAGRSSISPASNGPTIGATGGLIAVLRGGIEVELSRRQSDRFRERFSL